MRRMCRRCDGYHLRKGQAMAKKSAFDWTAIIVALIGAGVAIYKASSSARSSDQAQLAATDAKKSADRVASIATGVVRFDFDGPDVRGAIKRRNKDDGKVEWVIHVKLDPEFSTKPKVTLGVCGFDGRGPQRFELYVENEAENGFDSVLKDIDGARTMQVSWMAVKGDTN
jgi:H-type lectin domain